MLDQPRSSQLPPPELRGARTQRSRRVVFALMFTVATAVPAALTAFTQSAFAAHNVTFVGTWVPSLGAGQEWTVKSENAKTGVCSGTTVLSGYHFANCRVTGSAYSFWITSGTYKSHNTGTIAGNTLKGSFRDTNGTLGIYTAKRKR